MTTPEDMTSAMKEHSLANIIHDIGYAFTSSVEECKSIILNFGTKELTAIDVARTISMMIRYHHGQQSLVDFKESPHVHTPGNFWVSHEKKDIQSQGKCEWNAEVFTLSLKELAPNVKWKEVILQLDHHDFIVPDRTALNLLFTILRLGLESAGYPLNTFPVQYLYRRWTNLEGQMSLIGNILKHPDIFSFADYPTHAVSIDLLKSSRETENKEVGTWRSLSLVELLLYASEQGHYVQVAELFKIPLQYCPDVLLLVLLQIHPPMTPMRQELLATLIPIFLGNHPDYGTLMQHAWHTQNLNVKPIIMHAMADSYLRSNCAQSKLSKILDTAQDLKALPLLLNMQVFPFTIDLACLASHRKYLKLEKWLTDNIRLHGENFYDAMVNFLQKRCLNSNDKREEQPLKTMQLPNETISAFLACLQLCIPNVRQELQDFAYKVIANCHTLMLSEPRQSLPHTRVLETPASLGASAFTPLVDPMAMMMVNVSNLSLGAPTYTGQTTPGSPSRLMSAGVNSPFAIMSIQHDLHVTNIKTLPRMVPDSTMEMLRSQDPLPYPNVVHNAAKDIEDEANEYFKKIYNHPPHPNLSIDEVLDMLKKFQNSPTKREQEVFSCMLRTIFEEYKFFPQYPDRELHVTAQFFGGIIEKGLVPSDVSLGLALRCVLDALNKGEGTKMYYFGIVALDRFKSRLKDYNKYCEHVKAIPYFNAFPQHLIEYVEYGLQGQKPPTMPQAPVLAASSAAKLDKPAVQIESSRSAVCMPLTLVTTASSMAGRPSIANATNIDTLLTATDANEKIVSPPENVQDKTAFIFNNLSQLNLQPKCKELKEIVTEEYFPWLSQYLVMKRASVEFNFHALYSNFLDVLKMPEVNKMVTKETYRNIRVLLRSDKGIANFSDRSLLKSLGHWLGTLTLARNRPILHVDIDLKSLLLEAYHEGQRELLYVVPFVAKVLEPCAKSVVFKPPNPWTMALMNVLAELHSEPNLKLNLKFEIEVLCKNLSLDIADLKPSIYLRNPEKVKTIQFQLSSQPKKLKLEAEAVVTDIPGNRTVAKHMHNMQSNLRDEMKTAAHTQIGLITSDPILPAIQEPPVLRFNYLDIDASSTTAFGQKIRFNSPLPLLQNFPHLKQLVKPAIERSIQEWIHPVVDRAITYALTTCEHVIRKDFALEPEEARMRNSAHHMMRSLTAGVAMIACREQIVGTIVTNLKDAFTAAATPATPQDAIESAAASLAADNVELACAFIQKTAAEKALPEVDKRLRSDYEMRKRARQEGRRYFDPVVLDYHTERMPEGCRLRLGGPTDLQMSVYKEFAANIPGFLPVTDSSLLTIKPSVEELQMPQMTYGEVTNPHVADEFGALIAVTETFLASCVASSALSTLANSTHSLLECLYVTRRSGDNVSGCTLLQRAVEGIMELDQPLATPDGVGMMARYRDIHLQVLKVLEHSKYYGHEWTTEQVTRCLVECREELRYNVVAVDCLIRNRLVNMPQYDAAVSRLMDNGNNAAAVSFAMRLVQLYLINDRSHVYVKESDLYRTAETIARVMAHRRQPSPGPVGGFIEAGVVEQEPADNVEAEIQMEIMQVRSTTNDDLPGLQEKTEYILREWRNVLQSPLTEIDLYQNFNLFVHRMNIGAIFKSDNTTSRFLRISTQLCIENVYQALSEDAMNPKQIVTKRDKYYEMCDSFIKLVSLLIENTTDGGNVPLKLSLLNKTLGTIAGCLLRDQGSLGTQFQQLPYHRLLFMLFLDVNDIPQPALNTVNHQMVTSFSRTLHLVRPSAAAGFAYAWLEIIAHRAFIHRLLATTTTTTTTTHHKGWSMYSMLLIDLFKFLAPFLRNPELSPPVLALYKGLLKLLLVLLHDFPEFLCDYHYAFCDEIPPNCIQMRNLILCAFPRDMKLPDPFTPNLKVDLLEEMLSPPRSVVDWRSVLPNSQFKNDLDTYLDARAPVTFLSQLRSNMQVLSEPGCRYNSQLINAVVMYVGIRGIEFILSNGNAPSMSTIAHSSHMDIFQSFTVDLDYEGRYLFLNAIANQLRYPNSHTHYFSCVLLHLFSEANSDAIREQITRMLFERLIVNRPHPWGLLVTFIELIKNPIYEFWQHEFVRSAPEIEKNWFTLKSMCCSRR